MKDRIKQVREKAESKKMSQEAFGKKIGLTRDNVANIELGRVEPSEIVIRAIIREFGVNEYWLRTGEGDDMFARKTQEEEISAFFGSVIKSGTDDFRRRFITALSKLGPEEWKALNEIADKMYQSGAYSENGEKKERS